MSALVDKIDHDVLLGSLADAIDDPLVYVVGLGFRVDRAKVVSDANREYNRRFDPPDDEDDEDGWCDHAS